MVSLALGIEEIEVVVDSIVIASHGCPSEEEPEDSRDPEWSDDLLVPELVDESLHPKVVETSVRVVEVEHLVVWRSRVDDESSLVAEVVVNILQ